MAVVLGYLISTIVATVVVWAAAGRSYSIVRDPQVSLTDLGGRHVGILSGLAGFAVTGMVLLVTLGRNIPDTSSISYVTVVTMFFVSWMAYSGAGFMFANVSDSRPASNEEGNPAFDIAAAQFSGAAAALEIAFANGWLALRPLFQAFGLARLSELAAVILVAATVASYGLVSVHLHRSGYGTPRVLLAMPLLAAAGAVTYAVLAGALGLRSEEASLSVVVATFIVGAVAFALINMLPIFVQHHRTRAIVDRWGRYLVLAFVQSVVVLVAFLALSILGLA
jgi:hypothetical protein